MASDGERWTNYGPVFFEVEYWKEGERLEVPVMETEKGVLGEEHPDALTNMENLALTYSSQGRWKEAEQLLVQISEARTRVLGDEHPDTLTTTSNLAHALKSQGQDKNAVALMKNAVNLLIKHLGPLCRSNHLCSPIV